MYALETFKKTLGVEKIELLQGKGRMFARINEQDIFVSSNINWSKPVYVVKGKYDAWWFCNSVATVVKVV